MGEGYTVRSLFDDLDQLADEMNDYREMALEEFKGKHWAKGIVYAEKTDMTDADLQFYRGYCCEKGLGTEKEPGEAFEWYTKAVDHGHVGAMRNLGKMYEAGVWVNYNLEEAIRLYADAAVMGDGVSKRRLEKLAANSDTSESVVRAAKDAFGNDEWDKGVTLAFCTGMSDGGLQMWVGYCYDEGKGVRKNVAKAFEWYKKAANNGNAWSMNQLGLKYERGEGTDKDLGEAVRWYKAAAEKGSKYAQYNLADMYEYGKGTEKDLEEAVRWYRKAVEQGHEDAQKALERVEAEIAAAAADDPMVQLEKMIGLQSVKDQVKELVALVKVQKMKEASGLPRVDMSYHCVFTGNPGTGKTTVARIYAKILHKLGIINAENFVEADRSTLVSDVIGGTEKKVNEAVNAAMDGVLFIDEAYALFKESERDFGKEAVDILLKKMEDNRSRLVVILAGYEGKMERLFEMNEGMRSRFVNTIHFPDYSADELVEIFKGYAGKARCLPDEDALRAVREEAAFELGKKMEGFGNARYVRTLFERAVRRQSVRIAALGGTPGKEVLQRIVADDIPADSGRNGKEETVDDILGELDELVGLKPVKDEIRRLALFVQNQERRKEAGLPAEADSSYHCVFTGNPGTGKTTVAQYMARVFRALGITRTNHFEPADRSMLVGKYVGHTAPKTNKKIDAALNGVLFIDEAYSLVGKSENDFGHEAITTLLQRMENDRDRLVVIVAGYTKEMKDFIDANPGLKSRFTRYIEFPDYSADELAEVFARLAKKEGYRLATGAAEAVADYMKSLVAHKDSHFGNAREVRNFFSAVRERQAARLGSNQALTKEQMAEILPEDIPAAAPAGTEGPGATPDGVVRDAAVQHGLSVAIEYSRYINLALAQNQRPLVCALCISNKAGRAFPDCTCRISSPEGYVESYVWSIGDIADGQSVEHGAVPMRPNIAALRRIESIQAGQLCVEVASGGNLLFRRECGIDAIAPSHTHDIARQPDMLMAYVIPHCDAVRRLQTETARQLKAYTGSSALRGYAEDQRGVAEICRAIYEAVKGCSISYARSPARFCLPGQRVRLPGEIMEYKLATCLDTTLLFAAVAEACRLNPVVVLRKGHAFLGVFLEDRHLSGVAVDRLDEVRELCRGKKIIMVETTAACTGAAFDAALVLGAKMVRELDEGDFEWAIDVKLARAKGIRQLQLDVPSRPTAPLPPGPTPGPSSGSPGEGLSEARLSALKSPSALRLDGQKVASAWKWEDVFQKLYEKLNEMDAAKFDALPDDAQFGRYFTRLRPGQKTPRDYFKVKLGLDANVRAKKLANKVYLWRTDYYFRRLLERMGVDVSRIDII